MVRDRHLPILRMEGNSDDRTLFKLGWPEDVGIGGPLPMWLVDRVVEAQYSGTTAHVCALRRLQSLERTLGADPFLYEFETVLQDHIEDELWWGANRSFFALVEDCLCRQTQPGRLEPMLYDGLFGALAMTLFIHSTGAPRTSLAELARLPREGTLFRDIRIWRDLDLPRSKWSRERFPQEHHRIAPTFYNLLAHWMHDPSAQ